MEFAGSVLGESWILYTNCRQVKLGRAVDMTCFLCGREQEDHQHLFFRCGISRLCVELVQRWLGRPVGEEFSWSVIRRLRGRSMLEKLVLYAAFSGLVHHIWMTRNVCRVYFYIRSPTCIVNDLKLELRVRVGSLQAKLSRRDMEWLRSVELV
ncbi:hypothetical protein RND81_14G082300 [Saponaria officinalis]|uniref:Reverse transcriptase zinc-binding domain-containing protein n=1 Tax=Saponaria officinalis TaxID=3572 RepID=A0AAW1GMU9_SAPOF